MRSRKFICALLTAAFIAGSFAFSSGSKVSSLYPASTTVNAAVFNEQGVTDFVTRLYDICIGRAPDAAGLADWTGQLKNGKATGVSVAYGFIFSQEFQNKGYTNDEYVEIMYNAFFGRASDPTGKSNWLNSMNAGMTREELFMGFANSTEFFNLCNEYGITAGCHIMGRDFTQTAQINLFVERLYNVILGRHCDQAGMIDWSTKLANREISGAEAAYGFVFSPEYRNKNKSDSDFLEDLYNAFMGRGSDPTGKANWLSALNNGSSDRDIFNGFTGSQEFIAICNDYGIDKGGDITSGQTSARAGRSPAPTQHTHNYVAVRTWTESDTVTHYFCQGIDFGLDYDAALAYQASNGGSVYSDAVETNVQTYTYYECSCGAQFTEPAPTTPPETQAPTPTPKPAPTITGYELRGSAWDGDNKVTGLVFTGGSASSCVDQYETYCVNHGYDTGGYSIYAVYSDGSKKPAPPETQAPTPTPKPAPTISYYELSGTAFDDDGNEHSNTFTGGSKSDVKNQYTTWCDNHGYMGAGYAIYAIYSDGSRKPA